jgi:Flp pilus assembly protein TadG
MERQHAAHDPRDRGSAAVEFALLLPVLLLLIFGVVDFGRALNAQITLTQAAREGARLASFGQSTSTIESRAQSAATGLTLSASNFTTVTTCASGAGSGADGVVTISYQFSFITPIGAIATIIGGSGYGSSLTLTATGEMPCET